MNWNRSDCLGAGRRIGRHVFRDRYGYALWLGLLVMFGLYWRVGFLITDTYTTANTLVAVSNGQLHMSEAPYTLTLGSQPGLHESGGRLYGRNYGQVALAVPLVWTFQALSVFVSDRLLLLGLWSGTALAFVSQAAILGQRHTNVASRPILWTGSGIVAVLFLVGVATATALPDNSLPLAAFQASTMVAAATMSLVLYRLVGLWHDRAVALSAGVALGVSSSIGFWASLPKRHVLVGLLILTTVYLFARSRIAYDDRRFRLGLGLRAGAYLTAGLVTWTHAFEGFFLVAALTVVDLATARRNSLVHLAVVGVALFAGSLPMLVTNYLISGNPAKPPRLLPSIGGANVEFTPDTVDAGGEGGSGGDGTTSGDGGEGTTSSDGSEGTDTATTDSAGASTDGGTEAAGDSTAGQSDGGSTDGQTPVFAPILALLDRSLENVEPAWRLVSEAVGGGLDVATNPSRLSHIFLRSGTVPGINYSKSSYETIELTMLEAVPLFGAIAALPLVLVRLVGRKLRQWRTLPAAYSPKRQTDVLVTALAAVFTVIYLSRLPLNSQLTVRYLLPTVPLVMYGVFRVPAVVEAISDSPRWLASGYAGSVVLGLALGLGTVAGLDLAIGEAVQFHALVNLGGAAVCSGAVLGRTLAPDSVPTRAVGLGLALPAGLTTAYVLLSGLVYFQYGPHALDFVRVLTEYLPAV